jgi:hypothetical protein
MIEGDRLWSNLPFMRPLCGIIRDGCKIKDAPTGEGRGDGKNGGREEKRDERGGVTKWGGRCHDLLGTRCDPYGTFPSFSSLLLSLLHFPLFVLPQCSNVATLATRTCDEVIYCH